ncbi:MAG: hypothetical protein CHACPFDD_00629 [Phycisphaerae bacterium]|nr:hypothetical protein [Phycisphaerae bacterium]
MSIAARAVRLAGCCVVLSVALRVPPTSGQISAQGFVTSAAADAWSKWEAATTAIMAKDAAGLEKAFGELLALNPSAFRVALLAERSSARGQGGAVLLFEQDVESGKLSESGKRVAELLAAGREQMNEADDGWYFASIGRFDISDANFKALLASDPDPVAVLEFADRVAKRQEILVQLLSNSIVGDSCRQMLKVMARGENLIKADPGRIKDHIERLGGPPRGFENAVAALKDSGEYAIPFLVQYLRDPQKVSLQQPVLRCMPQIDRAALNPLVMALRMNDLATKRYLVAILGRIPYAQSLPYLFQLRDDSATPPEVRETVNEALASLRAAGVPFDENSTAADLFLRLAEAYYADLGSLAADTTLDTANVWYWREDMLTNIPVPTQVFNEVMTMRCCEEALNLQPDLKPALSLWLAADFRREAQLEAGQRDETRAAEFPSAAYFARTGGAEHGLATLGRAIRTVDPAVALGAIEALRLTAGPAALVGDEAEKLPLAEALNFPHRMVRIRAALALANARPMQQFKNYQSLMPVLSEALMLHGGSRNALVVDADEAAANQTVGVLRDNGYTVLASTTLFAGLDQVRKELPGLDVIFLASDVRGPELAESLEQLHRGNEFAAVPIVILSKPADRELVRGIVRADHRVAELTPGADAEATLAAVARVSKAVGLVAITPELGSALARETAETLLMLAETNNPVINDVVAAQNALISVVQTTQDAVLRVMVARVLGQLATEEAQQAIARIALDSGEEPAMRVAMFAALADAAKRRGNHLPNETVDQLIRLVETETDDTLRTAASQALGALNLLNNQASQLIRNQYRG